ncbi:MAG: molybdenum cofactor guanylyltransferase [Myxococcota bacterium]|nr:molybdenum cofactor guanylyltransferase [Myxococcota bacterium]
MNNERRNEIDCTAYILAGGASKRMGVDKGALEFEGRMLLERAIDLVSPFSSKTVLVLNEGGRYPNLKYPKIVDSVAGIGPLGALLAILEQLESEKWALITSCDVKLLKTAWVESLWAARTASSEAVVFKGDRWQPFHGIYKGTLLKGATNYHESGRRSLQGLLDQVNVTAVPLPIDWLDPPSFNSQEDISKWSAPPGMHL